MATKKGRGLGSYLIMFIGLAIAVVVVLFGVMIISPKVEIFGLKYLNATYQETLDRYSSDGTLHTLEYYNQHTDESSTLVNYVSKVVIESDTHNVEVRSKNNVTKPYVERTTNFIGFFKTKPYKNAEGKTSNPLAIQTSFLGGELKIKLTTPGGLVFSNNGKITVTLPASYSTNVELKVATTKGNINLGGVDSTEYTLLNFKTNNLTLSTISGDITLRKFVGINGTKADIKNEKGLTTIFSGFNNTTSLVASLSTKTGVILADKDESGAPLTFGVNKLDITSTLSDVKFSTITVGDTNYGTKFHGTSGRFFVDVEMKSALTCDDVTEYTDFHIKKINGAVLIPNAKSNSINIDETSAKITIIGKEGTVNIGKSTKEINIKMTGAEVNIKDASENVIVETTSGRVNLSDCKKFSVKTGDGAIHLDVSELSVLPGDAVHSAVSAKGVISATIDNNLQFNLKTEAQGKVSIELGSVHSPDHAKEETINQFNGGNINKILYLKTGKNISVIAKTE